jgi:hypothetical protein
MADGIPTWRSKGDEPSWKYSIEPVLLPACMGSFDFVRLAPHFAQDDSVEKFRVIVLAIGQGAEEVGATRLMHKDSFLCVLRDPLAIFAVRGFLF